MEYNIYCDESCHIEHDGNDIIVIGGISCKLEDSKRINAEILSLKKQFGYKITDEIKWTKISPSNISFFNSLVEYFFENKSLQFRGYICRGKDELMHDQYIQSYNEWYYKTYYRMLEYIIDMDISADYNVYIDIKDTIGKDKVAKLKEYMNLHHRKSIINNIQVVKSHEVALIQLADVLIGALSYKNRMLSSSAAKLAIVDKIETLSGNSISRSVERTDSKANWFVWTPSHWREI